ncbi:MAG: type II and III secretion system protein, partial [Planctomycetota bacterium]|nr:type II and III secretion system protein [Planctomycetota bacterium]
TQAVQFLDTGINLILRPFISRDNSIRMELYPSVSEYRLRTIGDGANNGFTTVPDEITNEITTNVRVRDGETIVLGGLFKDKAVTLRKSVPGLGDVPLLGGAFQGQDDSVERQEIIFLVTPTVVKEEVMDDASREANELVRDISVGVREGLLPWSREKMAANYNHDAHVALDRGDTDLAISFMNRSLRNDPNQPEIVRLRAKVLGERSIYDLEGDVLERVFRRTFRRSLGEIAPPGDHPTSDPLSRVVPGPASINPLRFPAAVDPFRDAFARGEAAPADQGDQAVQPSAEGSASNLLGSERLLGLVRDPGRPVPVVVEASPDGGDDP